MVNFYFFIFAYDHKYLQNLKLCNICCFFNQTLYEPLYIDIFYIFITLFVIYFIFAFLGLYDFGKIGKKYL